MKLTERQKAILDEALQAMQDDPDQEEYTDEEIEELKKAIAAAEASE